MSEIGALVVKLTAETAQFREDLGKVKRDLNDLKGGSESAGSAMAGSMVPARQGVMLLADEVGVHMPRALSMYVSKLPGVATAMQAAFPIIAIVAVIAIVGKLIESHVELKQKLLESAHAQKAFGNAAGEALSSLNEKLLQSGIKVDELRKNHVAALKKELQLIDDQSLDNLIETFNKFAGEADKVMADLKTSWYQFGIGAEGAKNALTEFQLGYEKLKLAGDKAGMDSLLSGTLRDAKLAQAALETLKAGHTPLEENPNADALQKQAQWQSAVNILKKDGLIPTVATEEAIRKELVSQNALVLALESQQKAATTIAQIKTTDTTGAKLAEAKRAQEEAKRLMEQELAYQHIVLAGTDAHIAAVRKLAQTNAEATLAAQKTPDQSAEADTGQKLAQIENDRQASIQAANDELNAKKRAYEAEIKAAVGNKAKLKELNAEWANDQVAKTDAVTQADAESAASATATLASAHAERIIENRRAVQQEADDTLRAALEAAKVKEQSAMDAAKHLEAMGRTSSQQIMAIQKAAINAEVAAEVSGYQTRIGALNKFSKEYEAEVRKLNGMIAAVQAKGATETAKLQQDDLQQQELRVKKAYDRMAEDIANDISKSIVMNKSLVSSLRDTGEQMAQGMIKNLIMAELTGDKQKLIDAKSAAANSFNWASAWGGPIAGGIAGAAAFAGVMAFANGGLVPGSGSGDTVPAMLTPGETVVTRALTERVSQSEGRGSSGGGAAMHMHFAPVIHAVDANGVDAMLTKHGAVFQRHITGLVRKMNK